MSTGSTWQRVTRAKPCPVCNKGDWCTVSADGSAVCCMRTESAKPLRNGGWLHRICDNASEHRTYMRRLRLPEPVRSGADCGQLAGRYAATLQEARLDSLARELGVSADSLRRLRAGWDGEAYTFPMLDVAGIVTGIRRRLPNGRKLSVVGGHEGLFVPADLRADGLLLVAEGPTDTAALLTLGFTCIGRPSCTGGVKLVSDMARERETVIVADADEPGRRGAEALAGVLALCCPSVRVIHPPYGVKDARAWVQRGATAADVLTAIDAAKPRRIGIKTRMAAR